MEIIPAINIHSEPDLITLGDGRKMFQCTKTEEQFYKQAFAKHNVQTSESSVMLFKSFFDHITRRMTDKVDYVEFELLSGSEEDIAFAFDDATKISRPYPSKGSDPEKSE